MPRDWFIAAIETDGSVGVCLDAVIAELHNRANFIKAIKERLAGSTSSGVDAITEISQRVKNMENTLRFRLGMLQADRPAAWFRTPVAQTVGPFVSTLIPEPVLTEYDGRPVAEVRSALLQRWTEASIQDLPFKSQGPSLWRTVLQMNQDLERINRLPAPWQDLRLDLLPDRLPENLESRALRAFLGNVRNEYFIVREKLDACYKLLKDATENLWDTQMKADQERAAREQRLKSEAEKAKRPWTDSANEMRDEFRRRRQSAQRERARDARASYGAPGAGGTRVPKSAKEAESLRLMGFEDFPSADSLRRRYLQLAKTHHPDRGGSEDTFKMLTRAYHQLAELARYRQ